MSNGGEKKSKSNQNDSKTNAFRHILNWIYYILALLPCPKKGRKDQAGQEKKKKNPFLLPVFPVLGDRCHHHRHLPRRTLITEDLFPSAYTTSIRQILVLDSPQKGLPNWPCCSISSVPASINTLPVLSALPAQIYPYNPLSPKLQASKHMLSPFQPNHVPSGCSEAGTQRRSSLHLKLKTSSFSPIIYLK